MLAESLSDLSKKMELLAIAICRKCPCWAYTASFGQTRQVPTRTVQKLRYPVDVRPAQLPSPPLESVRGCTNLCFLIAPDLTHLTKPAQEANEGLKTDVQLAIELERKSFVSETDVQTIVEMARTRRGSVHLPPQR